jgi:tetratricopeptide (TPR) repeat protein
MRQVLRAVLAAAAIVWPGIAAADQTDERLPALFERLKTVGSDGEARSLEAVIWQLWIDSPDPEIGALMQRGIGAMSNDQEEQAVAIFTEMVERKPDFAEGWNKRATVYFMLGEFDASVADIERTLALEPRHFGALSGLGQIYLELGRKEAALKAFEAALAIDPHLAALQAAVRNLKKALEGDPT